MKPMKIILRIMPFLLFLTLAAVYAQTDPLEEGRAAISSGDYKKALQLFQKSAKQGNALAQFNLAMMYDNGLGVKRNPQKALEWARKAADQQYPPAQGLVGAMYATGSGVKLDYLKAFEWYSRAAEQNEAEAQRRLGLMYSKGQGVEKDETKSVEWYGTAAENGNVVSMLILSRAYREGSLGLPLDPALAGQWYEKAVQAGLPTVDLNLDAVAEFAEGAQGQLAAFGPSPPAPFMEGAGEYQSFQEQVGVGAEKLQDFLLVHPENVQALILHARIGHLQGLLEPVVISGGQSLPDPAQKHVALHAALDRALELDPDNAEAHYWKARLYGVTIPVIRDDSFAMEHINLSEAIVFSQKAAALAPEEIAYREALALYLVANRQLDEALAVFTEVEAFKHPIYRLLSGWKVLPIPGNPTYLPKRTNGLIEFRTSRGRFKNYPALRLRAYLVQLPASELENFYRSHWPDFRLFDFGQEDVDGSTIRMYNQWLYWQGDILKPATDPKELEKLDTDVPSSGMELFIMEIRNPTPDQRSEYPVEVGNVLCELIITNFQKVE